MKLDEMKLNVPFLDQRHSLERSKEPRSKEGLKTACQQFEAILLNYMFQRMRASVPKSGFFDRSVAHDIVESMHDEALTEDMAKNGGIGLAKQLYDDLSKYL